MGIARNRGNLCQVLTAALLLMGSTPYAKADAGKGAPIPLQAAIPAGETLLVPRPARAEPARAPQASIRQLETDEAVSGSEPDPEAFDRRGLETWWRHYQDTLKKAE